jgi:hypothetical protein
LTERRWKLDASILLDGHPPGPESVKTRAQKHTMRAEKAGNKSAVIKAQGRHDTLPHQLHAPQSAVRITAGWIHGKRRDRTAKR